MAPRPPTIAALCAAHRNEEPHALHVTGLALRLFDRLAPRCRLRPSERRLLEAACRLHDIGYEIDASDHARAGAKIVLESGLAGFTKQETGLVAAVIRLHQGDPTRQDIRPAPGGRNGHHWRAQALAAFLRIADGMDRSHTQDAAIRSMRWMGDRLTIRLRCGWYPDNATRADRKADLWRHTFRFDIRIVAESPPPSPSAEEIVSGRDSAFEAARVLLAWQYRLLVDKKECADRGGDPECCHDLRIALRRCRALLRFFQPMLAAPDRRDIDRMCAGLCRRLGKVRDLEVWRSYCSQAGREAPQRPPAWDPYLTRLDKKYKSGAKRLRRIVNGARWKACLSAIIRCIRVDMSARPPQCYAIGLRPFAQRRLLRFFHRMDKHAGLLADGSPQAMHALRKFFRRERYYAEFSCMCFPFVARDFAPRLKRASAALGLLHDMDCGVERMRREGHAPRALRRLARQSRQTACVDFVAEWEKLNGESYRRRMKRGLGPASSPGQARSETF
jgi:CHAD domain-containing protein